MALELLRSILSHESSHHDETSLLCRYYTCFRYYRTIQVINSSLCKVRVRCMQVLHYSFWVTVINYIEQLLAPLNLTFYILPRFFTTRHTVNESSPATHVTSITYRIGLVGNFTFGGIVVDNACKAPITCKHQWPGLICTRVQMSLFSRSSIIVIVTLGYPIKTKVLNIASRIRIRTWVFSDSWSLTGAVCRFSSTAL